jgi:hypothetical protein
MKFSMLILMVASSIQQGVRSVIKCHLKTKLGSTGSRSTNNSFEMGALPDKDSDRYYDEF